MARKMTVDTYVGQGMTLEQARDAVAANSRKGGLARARRLSPERRSEIARMGGRAILQKYGREHFRRIRFGMRAGELQQPSAD